MEEPAVSVVVPAYRAARTISACLKALNEQTVERGRYELIVVDDGSDDATVVQARQAGADRVLTVPHGGPAAARNAGVAAARGAIVLFTDADCEPAPDWIERMLAPFDDPAVDGAKGVYRTRQRSWVARFVQLEYEDKYDRMRGRQTIDFVDTYAAAYRRRVFADGGFDPAFPAASGEDVEFSYRLARQGRRLVFAPDAVVYHQHPATLARYARRKYYVGFWRVRMVRLHPDKVIDDAHTPQSLKLQVVLMALILLSLALALFWSRALFAVGGLLLVFLLSALPFLLKALRRDAVVAFVAPWLLLVRALALGLGFAAGLVWQAGLFHRRER